MSEQQQGEEKERDPMRRNIPSPCRSYFSSLLFLSFFSLSLHFTILLFFLKWCYPINHRHELHRHLRSSSSLPSSSSSSPSVHQSPLFLTDFQRTSGCEAKGGRFCFIKGRESVLMRCEWRRDCPSFRHVPNTRSSSISIAS